MIQKPMDVLEAFPVRKSKKQKQAFRQEVLDYFQSLGYESMVEKGSCDAHNVIAGDPERAKYLITAHYDTCARLPFPNFITPCNIWMYLAYQLLIVVGFFAIAFGIGFLSGMLIPSPEIASLTAMAVYWGLFILLFFGPANKHNANDNTSGVVTVLDIAAKLPPEQRNQVCFVLFDLEEAGLFGSASYRKQHKAATENQIIINLDCVGDGDEILMFPTKKLKKDGQKMELLRSLNGTFGAKKLVLHEKFGFYPSDQAKFPYGVGVAALRRGKHVGLYCSKIHTSKDTTLDVTNVERLSLRLTEMLERANEI